MLRERGDWGFKEVGNLSQQEVSACLNTPFRLKDVKESGGKEERGGEGGTGSVERR